MNGVVKKQKIINNYDVIYTLLCEKQPDIMTHILFNYLKYTEVITYACDIDIINEFIIERDIIERIEQRFMLFQHNNKDSKFSFDPVVNGDNNVTDLSVSEISILFTRNDSLYGMGYGIKDKFIEIPTKIDDFDNITCINTSGKRTMIVNNHKLHILGCKTMFDQNAAFRRRGQPAHGVIDDIIYNFDNITYISESGPGQIIFVCNYKLYNVKIDSNKTIITRVEGFDNVTSVFCRNFNVMFVNDNKLYGYGSNRHENMGLPRFYADSDTYYSKPTRIGNYNNVTFVTGYRTHTVFINNGQIYGMGGSVEGALGIQDPNRSRSTVVRIGDFTKVTHASCTYMNTYVVNDGILYGMGISFLKKEPKQITSDQYDVIKIAASPYKLFMIAILK